MALMATQWPPLSLPMRTRSIQDPGTLANMVASSISATAEEKQKVLELDNVKNRLKEVMRLVNHCKRRGITVVLINQTADPANGHVISGIGISSVVDTIITLTYHDCGDETCRRLKVLKSRGSRHSGNRHDFRLSDAGIRVGSQAPDRQAGQTT